MTTYEKLLCAAAEYEVEQLKKSGKVFIIDKTIFRPDSSTKCIYGQTFEGSYSIEAINFKRNNNILTGFGIGNYIDLKNSHVCETSALEILTSKLWQDNKKEQVYKIVEQFAIWKDHIPKDTYENLFTL